MFGLDSFTFAQLWKPLELMIYIVIAAVYLLITGPYREIFGVASLSPGSGKYYSCADSLSFIWLIPARLKCSRILCSALI